MRIRSFSPRRSEPNWTKSGLKRSQTCVRSTELRPMSPAVTTRWAYPGSAPGRDSPFSTAQRTRFRHAVMDLKDLCATRKGTMPWSNDDYVTTPSRIASRAREFVAVVLVDDLEMVARFLDHV